MKILVFDTETTGLPQSKIINPKMLHMWPYIVQFSYIIYDTNLNDIIYKYDSLIKLKDDIIIPEDSIKIHNITNDMSQKNGLQINIVFDIFFEHLKNVDLLVGHNILFDINMIKIELLRLIYNNEKIENELKNYNKKLYFLTNYKNIYCTLKESIEFCNIKAINKVNKEYLKFPKLIELHEKLFETKPTNLHNSLNDVFVTLRCFIKLKYNIDLKNTCDKFIIFAEEKLNLN
jgi:DNA polymerase III epsilon subunit-like protein